MPGWTRYFSCTRLGSLVSFVSGVSEEASRGKRDPQLISRIDMVQNHTWRFSPAYAVDSIRCHLPPSHAIARLVITIPTANPKPNISIHIHSSIQNLYESFSMNMVVFQLVVIDIFNIARKCQKSIRLAMESLFNRSMDLHLFEWAVCPFFIGCQDFHLCPRVLFV